LARAWLYDRLQPPSAPGAAQQAAENPHRE
jgi:hypothetical protein